jgi:hypothetical protein
MQDRWVLIRDVAVFQFKLLIDSLRDVLLVPVSIAAGIVSLVGRRGTAGTEFYDLLQLGRRSERWINLFGAAASKHGPESGDPDLPGEDIDELVARVESFIVAEYRKGGITAQAREVLERALARVRKRQRDDTQRHE